jgi:hypothetical protein
MKILTAEISLREETRGLEQAKARMESDHFTTSTEELAITQQELADRTTEVIEKIYELPEGEQKFGKEINQLTNAAHAMDDAEEILAHADVLVVTYGSSDFRTVVQSAAADVAVLDLAGLLGLAPTWALAEAGHRAPRPQRYERK